MNKHLDRYLSYLNVEKGYSDHTIKTYKLIIQDFLIFIINPLGYNGLAINFKHLRGANEIHD